MTAPVWSTVMVTGHRPQHLPKPGVRQWVRDELDRVAGKLRADHGMKRGYTGLALGPDQWWADALHWKDTSFVAHIPYLQQPDRWKQSDREEWLRLRALAEDEVLYGDLEAVNPAARKWHAVKLLHARNDGMLYGVPELPMIGPADACVAVWCPSKRDGGTFSAVEKAHKRNLPVILINPETRITSMPSRDRLADLLYPHRPQSLIEA